MLHRDHIAARRPRIPDPGSFLPHPIGSSGSLSQFEPLRAVDQRCADALKRLVKGYWCFSQFTGYCLQGRVSLVASAQQFPMGWMEFL
ncbi:MAG: hypothetical protein ACK5O5_01510, partial [bacterium]